MSTGKVRGSLLLVTVLLGTGGCGGGSPAQTTAAIPDGTTSPPVITTPAANSIAIQNFEYGAPVTVSPGTVVTVTNLDSARHTVTADDGGTFAVDVAGSGGTATFTAPSTPGSYPFHCTYHPRMQGMLTVK
jgi:plastocyanin